ncbi:XdhC family protein [Thalassomonas actiniarum]|uniref:XdhC family protein n=1 Tax=Thalassomonas actiniarum TaxID=485447 RepID=A0AAF0C4U4_9GAMM|nr:XdhC/CoxI family protein [Thalassomonas actiniarum]WDE00359.1 XdhC family protein [Thalassomonas actiniarum]
MQENWLQLAKTFDAHKQYVLATIVATRGSTYRKMGTMMLIDEAGVCTGLLSGGCLEADISLHAGEVLAEKKSRLLNYDLLADAELLWGLGLGCDGEIDILLQPLLLENNHLGFADLLNDIGQQKTGHYWIQVNDNQAAQGQYISGDLQQVPSQVPELANQAGGDAAKIIVIPVLAPVSLLVCGAGPDAAPVVNMALELGWQVTVWDHRENYLNQDAFSRAAATRLTRPVKTATEDYRVFDAAVVMTHNLTSDGEYLAHLLAANTPYIGLLGPGGRRDKLLKPLELTPSDVKGQVFGPVGLDLGGRSPQAIALSITAQIQQQMSLRYAGKHYRAWTYVGKELSQSQGK